MQIDSVQSYEIVSSPSKRQLFEAYWRLILLMGIMVVLYGPVLLGLMMQAYKDPDYSHVFFVPLFSGYLIWQKRQALAQVHVRSASVGLWIVIGAQLILFLGSLGAELFLARISLLATIAGLVIYFRGWETFRLLSFSLAFLMFMVPLPELIYNEIVFPLQLIASRFATTCLEGVRVVPVLREGNLLVLPNYTLEVVEACSGIRSLMALLALATGYGYLVETRLWVRCVLVVAMLPLAILSNGLRVMAAALLTHYYGPDTAEGFLHTFSGLMIFLFVTLLLLLLHKAMSLSHNFTSKKK